MNKFSKLWSDQRRQDTAEYALMLAVILVLVVGTIRLVGSNANNVFSSVASSVHQGRDEATLELRNTLRRVQRAM